MVAPASSASGEGKEQTAAEARKALLVRRGAVLLTLGLLVVHVLVVLRTAWLSDDAFITLRTLENLKHGLGLVYNAGERVMGFTHPLWALLLSLPIECGVSAYAAAMGASLVCSLLAAIVVLRAAASLPLAAVALSWLSLSSAYVDYSTSGLENPLTHLLLASFVALLIRRRAGESGGARSLFLLGGLAILNRMDLALLVLPGIATEIVEWRKGKRFPLGLRPLRAWGVPAVVGFLPLAVWLTFAIVYFGFPFPNTAYAKLNTRIDPIALALQGGRYLADSLRHDPLTLLLIALFLVLALRSRSRSAVAVGLGTVLYLVYVVRIGGDFMSGRFLAAPLLVSVVWLTGEGLSRTPRRVLLGLAGLTSIVGIAFMPGLFVQEKREKWGPSGIANERLWYGIVTRLAVNLREPTYEQQVHYQRGVKFGRSHGRVAVEGSIGMFGFAAGPDVHVIDVNALTDPLLARIPFGSPRNFRIGHFQRALPRGYERTIRDGRNVIVDPCIHDFYDVLSRVVHGPLLTRDRFAALVALNLGRYDALVRQPCPAGYRH
jgi:arabinofuranosyltransferase